jgi:hypothetical protein
MRYSSSKDSCAPKARDHHVYRNTLGARGKLGISAFIVSDLRSSAFC